MKTKRLIVRVVPFFALIFSAISITSVSQAAPAVNPIASTVVASLTTLPADGKSFTKVTINAVANNSKPANITSASLLANPSTGVLYAVAFSSNPPPPTPGQVVFEVSSTVAEQVTFTAVINGVTLLEQPVVTFTAPSTGLVN